MITIILLCIAGFLAAFVDSIAGGGGLISVPAFMLTGLPIRMVLGTNKFSATAGSFTSSL
ncbi:MAG: TSUP family transporter, partial [Clostridiaceae bacterium]|nr:TSUP family transporter [Clostridiaceae bacterium]